MAQRLKPRRQGDLGELSALEWFGVNGYAIFVPVGHSPCVDMVAVDEEGRALRVQVKTGTYGIENGRYEVSVCTRGGNQSWNGLVKNFSAETCDFLFVHVADGRRFLIPADKVEGATAIIVGGPKYAPYEVDRGRPLIMNGTT